MAKAKGKIKSSVKKSNNKTKRYVGGRGDGGFITAKIQTAVKNSKKKKAWKIQMY